MSTRNLTEVFIFLRSNDQQSRNHCGYADNEDKVRLIGFDEEKGIVSAGSKSPPSWVNVLDEINYEMTRIKTRKATLRELQQKTLSGLDFNEESSSPDQEKIKELTDEITTMFTHVRRLIRLLEESEPDRIRAYIRLRENVVSSLMLALNNLLHNFRASQSTYLKHLDSRRSNVDSFLLASSASAPIPYVMPPAEDNYDASSSNAADDEELSISQIQQIMQNEHMTKEREKEVIKISTSILELNNLFKDVASLILDQGTILDRIDYNVDVTAHRIKSAYKSVEKAQQYQRNRKMQFIVVLAGFAIFLMLLILLIKL
ncbi:SNARE domain-containing protein [Ditylenchus destructor]|nr:SNARE domain-containing protein [Ditylenchus destructor]